MPEDIEVYTHKPYEPHDHQFADIRMHLNPVQLFEIFEKDRWITPGSIIPEGLGEDLVLMLVKCSCASLPEDQFLKTCAAHGVNRTTLLSEIRGLNEYVQAREDDLARVRTSEHDLVQARKVISDLRFAASRARAERDSIVSHNGSIRRELQSLEEQHGRLLAEHQSLDARHNHLRARYDEVSNFVTNGAKAQGVEPQEGESIQGHAGETEEDEGFLTIRIRVR